MHGHVFSCITTVLTTCTHIKLCGLIFRVFDWQEYSWGINFRGYGGVVGAIAVGFTKYAD